MKAQPLLQTVDFEARDNPEIRDVCKDWSKARMEAVEKTPFDDLARVLQEIDNFFNEIVDYIVYCQSLKAAS